ncbi:hypothetical protein OG767_10960 [Micromonospora sp. NBC_01392]|uniref:hypothetical protein n=1 Tax=Micromonospora sp. NBC_01392 TaxID=2903588 RepID=UPI00324E7C61
MRRPRTLLLPAATMVITLGTGLLPALAQPAVDHTPADAVDERTCIRTIEGVDWFFDPCVAPDEPLPPDVRTGIEEDRQARCGPTGAPSTTPLAVALTATPSASSTATGAPTSIPTSTGSAGPGPSGSVDPSASAVSPSPCPVTPSPTVPASGPPSSPGTTTSATPPTTAAPSSSTVPPSASVPPSATVPPSSSAPPSTAPPSSTVPPSATVPPSGSPSPPAGGCAATGGTAPTDSRLPEAEKDRLCPPNRNPAAPAVLVATGDSVTSAHIQAKHHHEPKKCAVNQNTQADQRGLPGNDMTSSYAGRYVTALNQDVVEYYNFARTGMGTGDILGAPATYPDACENLWSRTSPPIALAEAAVAKAKQDRRKAYFVTTGGINNTNWTQVAQGIAMCGMAELMRTEMVKYFIRNNLPLNAVMRWYDTTGKQIGRDDVIKGGACQVVLQENVNAGNEKEVTVDRLRFVVPAFDGPANYAKITADANAITTRMVRAGADKVVWMGYYDITPAKVALGSFAQTYVQNTKLPDPVKGALPNIPDVEVDLVTQPAWKTQVQTWTKDVNNAIRASILPADPIVRFQPAPALTSDKIQKKLIGGCPHPNLPGHDELAKALDAAIKA